PSDDLGEVSRADSIGRALTNQIPRTKNQIPGKKVGLGSWNLVLGIWFLEFGSSHLVTCLTFSTPPLTVRRCWRRSAPSRSRSCSDQFRPSFISTDRSTYRRR